MTAPDDSPRRITSIVEGHGEVAALPILLRRICAERGHYPLTSKPHRIPRTDFTTSRLTDAYRLQRARAADHGIVVVLCDLGDDDPIRLRAAVHAVLPPDDSLVIGVAVREYEAWFLAALESLRGHRAVRSEATNHLDAERPRNAKKRLEEAMHESYKETIHQAAFSELAELDAVRSTCPSFRDLCEALWRALDES